MMYAKIKNQQSVEIEEDIQEIEEDIQLTETIAETAKDVSDNGNIEKKKEEKKKEKLNWEIDLDQLFF